MIVSWNWLQQYVPLDMPVEALTHRLTMAGLNLESVEEPDGDRAIDLEVTSNRPDCLGHIGVAREVGVLFGSRLTVPDPQPRTAGEPAAAVTSVVIDAPDLCPRYVARVIRNVKIGPSPEWLIRRLQAVLRKHKGAEFEEYRPINNVADITNYVLLECGQPLHAFDFDKLHGRRIVVRRARAGEKLVAIDQREYVLDPEMCVIADADRPVAIGGVMGGLDTEIGPQTANVLIEVADFMPLSIRATARRLGLHSPSSYRFERGVDPQQLDWASRRCCELILEIAGGELLEGPVIAGSIPQGDREPIALRFAQIPRILGIEIPPAEAVRILESLGLKRVGEPRDGRSEFIPPSWRRDLTREIDLIEEVARVHGYDRIPDDAAVPLGLSSASRRERVVERVRRGLTAAGSFEAMTLSLIGETTWQTPERGVIAGRELFTPVADAEPIRVQQASWKQENVLRQSLVPSLLAVRRNNERHGVFHAELFEIAKVYLAAAPGRPEREVEPTRIGLVSGRSFHDMKGVVESLLDGLHATRPLTVRPSDVPQFAPGRGAELWLGDERLGWLGEMDRSVTDTLDLRDACTVAELDLAVLEDAADLMPTFTELPQFPAVERDLNFVLDESVAWDQLEATARAAAGPLLESIQFGGQYRGQQIGPEKKSYVVRLSYRAPDRTLTTDEVDQTQQSVITACGQHLGAVLR